MQYDTWNVRGDYGCAAGVQADPDKEGVDQAEQTLNVESEEWKPGQMLMEFNVTIGSNREVWIRSG